MTEPLEDPGPPLIMTLKTTSTGETSINYTIDHAHAVAILRELADSIEAKNSE